MHIEKKTASLLIYIRVSEFSFFAVFLPPPRCAEPFIISLAALYSVTPLRGWEIAFPLVDECGRRVYIQSKSRHIRGGKKQNRQWTARFRLESYQSLSGHNPTSATCYLPYTPRSIRPAFELPLEFAPLPGQDHNGNPSIRHRYPVECFTSPREQRAWVFRLYICVFCVWLTRKLHGWDFDPRVFSRGSVSSVEDLKNLDISCNNCSNAIREINDVSVIAKQNLLI